MSSLLRRASFGLSLLLTVSIVSTLPAEESKEKPAPTDSTKAQSPGTSGGATATAAGAAATSSSAKPSPITGAKEYDGLIPLFQKEDKLFAEIGPAQMGQEFFISISIARGIGEGPVLGGMSWGFGDDWVWVFRKAGNNMLIVRRNTRFRAAGGSPEATAVKFAYTDSVLFSLPIVGKGPAGGSLIDITSVFMSDLPQLSRVLPGFVMSPSKSEWASIKGFKGNVELQVAATYVSPGVAVLETVPDSRGLTVNVHYSISSLKPTGYTPRLADDRVGYFTTVAKDYSKKGDSDRFVRYINRWHLVKADSAAKLSPPKEPIIFWIEKTVPFKYRKAVREGILEWNKAFEKAGYVNAIEVRQQPDDADWDPEDINYNTFRWITASAGFAMGPSRVNPRTGQILDADIIFDADFLEGWSSHFDTLTPKAIAEMTGGSLEAADYAPRKTGLGTEADHECANCRQCQLARGMMRQLAIGQTSIDAIAADPAQAADLKEKLIMQGLKEVVMHEVGHTLGLRHNFKASTWRSLKDIQDPAKVKDDGMVASVMDYTPANLVPKGMKQGDFYTTTLGPYDLWAIEYGYSVLAGGTDGETAALRAIASRSGEPALAFSTDEDTRGIDPDPTSMRFDLGSDPIEYARSRAQLVKQLIPGLVDRSVKQGDSYEKARRTFNVLLAEQGTAAFYASRYIGGMKLSRSHKGDKGAQPPAKIVDVKQQRDALAMLEELVFSDKPFNFPPEMYNSLMPARWSHWGMPTPLRPDFPIHDVVLMWQSRILSQILSPVTLERMHDAELKVSSDADALTTAELLNRLTKVIFSEVDGLKEGEYTNRKPAISSLRRNLQRSYMRSLSNIALGKTGAPEDCQSIAFAELNSLEKRIDSALKSKVKLDGYTQAHLEETASRIRKVLEARLTIPAP